MQSVPLLRRVSFKIIAGLILMLALVGIPFFLAFLEYHRNQLLETMESLTMNMSRALTHQLEVSVLESRNHELNRIVQKLAASGDVREIMIINSAERVAVASDPQQVGRKLSRHDDRGCRECHVAVALKDTMLLQDGRGNAFYRNVTVIQNRPSCYPCHDPSSPVNGIIIMDFSQDLLQSRFRAGLIRFVLMAVAMLTLTLVVLYILLHRLVLRRLRRFSDAADQIGEAKFSRISMPGSDEFTQLADSFNLMSQRLESAMHQIQGSKEYLESVLNNIDDEIVVLSRSFDVVTANAAYWRDSAGPAARVRHAYETCACARTFEDGEVHKIVQTAVRDGRQRQVEVFCSPLRDAAGEVYEVIEVRRDITERKLLEANLAHSERLISMGLLASGLSHEINNPLASIATFVEGLQRKIERSRDGGSGDFQGLDKSLGLIQREIERARDITRRLLILAQKDESARSLVDINESLGETILLVRHEASKRGISVGFERGAELPILRISEAQVRQVFLNLLFNALQAGHEGGQIHCRTWKENGGAFACVQDDGTGIEPSELAGIFEPFYSKRASGQGTGLGLFICRSIVSSWGGEITVHSLPGHGSTFTIAFPAPA